MSAYKGYIPTVSTSSAGGVWTLREQLRYQRDGVWVTNPPVFIQNAAGLYYFTPYVDMNVLVKMWGGAGGTCQISNGGWGGAGGYAEGELTLYSTDTYVIVVGGGGTGGNFNGGGGGGGYSGLFLSSISQANAYLIAGGGGGGIGDNGASYLGGAGGGGSSGVDGLGWRTTTNFVGGKGGTQIAGGAIGNGDISSATPGSALQGGSTGNANVSGGYGGGGNGSQNYGYDGGGGGGGYYGGGAGGSGTSSGKNFGGGGSGYYKSGTVLYGTLISGYYTTPGNTSDTDRGTAGSPVNGSTGNPGKVIMWKI